MQRYDAEFVLRLRRRRAAMKLSHRKTLAMDPATMPICWHSTPPVES